MATMLIPKVNKSPLLLSIDAKRLPNIFSETTITMSMPNDMDHSDFLSRNQLSSHGSPALDSSLDWIELEETDLSGFVGQDRDLSAVPSELRVNHVSALYSPTRAIINPLSTMRSYAPASDNGLYIAPTVGVNKHSSHWQINPDTVYGYPSLYSEDEAFLNLQVAYSSDTYRLDDSRFRSSPASPYPSDSSQGFLDEHHHDICQDDDSLDETFAMARTQQASTKSENYATLLYQCLLSAKDCQRELREIYRWFELYTDKANSTKDGWRNSVRHNLSMNEAFESAKGHQEDNSNRHWWRLTPKALQDRGVEPTTRFRNKPGKPRRNGHGGRVAKRNHHDVRRSTRLGNGQSRQHPFEKRQQYLMHTMEHEVTSNPDFSRLSARYSSLPPSIAHQSPDEYMSPRSSYDPGDYDGIYPTRIDGLQRPGSEPPIGMLGTDGAMNPTSHHFDFYDSPRTTIEPATPGTGFEADHVFGASDLANGLDEACDVGLDTERLFAWPSSC